MDEMRSAINVIPTGEAMQHDPFAPPVPRVIARLQAVIGEQVVNLQILQARLEMYEHRVQELVAELAIARNGQGDR